MPRRAIVVCTWLALIGTGCANTGPRGRPVIAYRPDRPAEVRSVRTPATHLLFRGDRSEEGAVLAVRPLTRADEVGFARESDGSLVAIAGADRIRLSEGRYRWHTSPPANDALDARLSQTGRWYMNGVEPVGKAISVVVLAPVFLVMAVFGIYLPGGAK